MPQCLAIIPTERFSKSVVCKSSFTPCAIMRFVKSEADTLGPPFPSIRIGCNLNYITFFCIFSTSLLSSEVFFQMLENLLRLALVVALAFGAGNLASLLRMPAVLGFLIAGEMGKAKTSEK